MDPVEQNTCADTTVQSQCPLQGVVSPFIHSLFLQSLGPPPAPQLGKLGGKLGLDGFTRRDTVPKPVEELILGSSLWLHLLGAGGLAGTWLESLLLTLDGVGEQGQH